MKYLDWAVFDGFVLSCMLKYVKKEYRDHEKNIYVLHSFLMRPITDHSEMLHMFEVKPVLISRLDALKAV